MVDPTRTAHAQRARWASWQRRLLETAVAVLSFGVWGWLAYVGAFRLLARAEGVQLGGSWIRDALSLMIGIAGSVAGISALIAVGMRLFGRTPSALIGRPDDTPEDQPASQRPDRDVTSAGV